MKKSLIIIMLFLLTLSANSQNEFGGERFAFSIGISPTNEIEAKVERYLERNKKKYELIYICRAQRIYVIELKNPTYTPVTFFKQINGRFGRTQFLFKNMREMTDFSCRLEYLKILSEEIK